MQTVELIGPVREAACAWDNVNSGGARANLRGATAIVGAKVFNLWVHIWWKFESYHCFSNFWGVRPHPQKIRKQ